MGDHSHSSRWDEARFREYVMGEARGFFDGPGPLVAARAPGRLDLMGGVADYCGSLVLEYPLAPATWCAVQSREEPVLRARTLGIREPAQVDVSIASLLSAGAAVAGLRGVLSRDASARWAGYALGGVAVLLESGWLRSNALRGVNLLLASDVPAGAGVSSSASVEVASLQALCGLFGLEVPGLELARLAQRVENDVVGAPCGIMDQMTVALGKAGHLAAIRCQPHAQAEFVSLPEGVKLFGIDSGVKHLVGGSRYTQARVAAFMGLALLREAAGGDLWGGFLCNLRPEQYRTMTPALPEQLLGAEFLRCRLPWPDPATQVDPAVTYAVRACTEHPINENARVEQLARRLKCWDADPHRAAICAGGLMAGSHLGYGRIGLGSPETDWLVAAVRRQGLAHGLAGARVTGGGSGGTVAVLATGDARPSLETILDEYARVWARPARLIEGSSSGALEFGLRRWESA